MIDKLAPWGDSIFSIMTAAAKQYGALNLAQGFPDFPTDPALISAVHQAMVEGNNQYAPANGAPVLVEAVSRLIKEEYSYDVDGAKEITVVSGATYGIYATLQALIHPGDEVIYIEPGYDSYAPSILMAGGRPVPCPCFPPDFSMDWDRLESLVNPNTRMIIFNNPNNPTGVVWSVAELEQLGLLAEKHDLLVLSDEVYEFIRFTNEHHVPAYCISTLSDRSITLSSFGKTLHVTGWKMGYSVASPAITTLIRKVNQFLVFCSNHPVQLGIAHYLQGRDLRSEVSGMYAKKIQLLRESISGSRFKLLQCSGTYFQLLDYGVISDESSRAMAQRLVQEYGIATIPVAAFYSGGYDPKLLRICFAKEDSTLLKAGEILNKI